MTPPPSATPSNPSASVSAPPRSALTLAATDNGCVIRVQGRGTMLESTAAKNVAMNTLKGDSCASVALDLTECEYLDSTFLGCIAELFRGFGRTSPPRFQLVAPPQRHQALLGACRMDRVVPASDSGPAIHGSWIALPVCKSDPGELTKHVIACHKALAEIDGPMRESFAKLASRLESELSMNRPTA